MHPQSAGPRSARLFIPCVCELAWVCGEMTGEDLTDGGDFTTGGNLVEVVAFW